MDWIVIAIMATIIVSLTALSLWYAKKEDDELAELRRKYDELEKNYKKENEDEH